MSTPHDATDDTHLLTAAFVAPMTGPIIRDGAVIHARGRILAIGEATRLRRDFPHAAREDLGNVTLLPGLVNAHAHLELSLHTPGNPRATFTDWVLDLLHAQPSNATDATLHGIDQCLRFGVTTIGDITTQPQTTRSVLRSSPLRAISYGEVRGMAQRRGLLDERIAAAIDPSETFERVVAGISPHAPYSIEAHGYARCLAEARASGLPLATHLAETPYEAEFLARHTGPFRELWRALDAWDDEVSTFDGGPIRFAQHLGLLDYPTLLAHVNYADDDELALLARGRASVIYCPRTHAYFNHPPHRWRDMLALGVNVALGTDSCASSPDLNLVDDLRFVHGLAPDVPPHELWQLFTTRAAQALMQPHIGHLSPGAAADLVAFPTTSDDPLREILETDVLPSRVWVDGSPVS